MFIECYKNNGIPYLRLVRSIRRPSKIIRIKLLLTNIRNFQLDPFRVLMMDSQIM